MPIIPSFRDATPPGPAPDPNSPDEEAAAAILAEMLGTAKDANR